MHRQHFDIQCNSEREYDGDDDDDCERTNEREKKSSYLFMNT